MAADQAPPGYEKVTKAKDAVDLALNEAATHIKTAHEAATAALKQAVAWKSESAKIPLMFHEVHDETYKKIWDPLKDVAPTVAEAEQNSMVHLLKDIMKDIDHQRTRPQVEKFDVDQAVGAGKTTQTKRGESDETDADQSVTSTELPPDETVKDELTVVEPVSTTESNSKHHLDDVRHDEVEPVSTTDSNSQHLLDDMRHELHEVDHAASSTVSPLVEDRRDLSTYEEAEPTTTVNEEIERETLNGMKHELEGINGIDEAQASTSLDPTDHHDHEAESCPKGSTMNMLDEATCNSRMSDMGLADADIGAISTRIKSCQDVEPTETPETCRGGGECGITDITQAAGHSCNGVVLYDLQKA